MIEAIHYFFDDFLHFIGLAIIVGMFRPICLGHKSDEGSKPVSKE